MKSTGIVRRVDDLGRIVIPIDLRRTLNIEPKSPLEIYVDDNKIILKKHKPTCFFCGSTGETIEFKGKIICSKCLEDMKTINK
ncbi:MULTISPECIES: AbrB/MazE/SpoVT family DNA-binding domain-containing protein [unclassified Candidatus Frackibacter]|uniref:AbrB/MazE/SpoVT family DNA-binding domain-containing protein n=1 Tax=unclassified Candidatus Frackibacter TaxID=2648818 RepID=UPI00088828C7|nr:MULTISPECIES: AbrB/MazE/SpoVT family DNA-binding domain-containing protein [unclassified Candidatus Frackibacter]SDC56422.1 transcriptional regulator, AbrB family [Candidatus Frackibacter sp. WG11]SEM70740.1 transcriptional regulator, AbrB family [Candidatus Frackibacter sp. WG12]SFL83619.1 transcriptional regulator, AbrB family [Candidatus Frackibacter sp. WG13]